MTNEEKRAIVQEIANSIGGLINELISESQSSDVSGGWDFEIRKKLEDSLMKLFPNSGEEK